AGLTDASGVVVNTYAYDPFGGSLWGTGTMENQFQYAGRSGVAIDGSGLVYMRARYYDPGTGRFAAMDPIRLTGDTNLYRYVRNNPTQFTDPRGTDIEAIFAFCTKNPVTIVICGTVVIVVGTILVNNATFGQQPPPTLGQQIPFPGSP